jgi:putative ABC transport system ATP-binding protein
MLRMEAVTKIYDGRGRTVAGLRSVTLDIPKGDSLCVVGPSGCGKSTLLLILGGMLSPTEGRVLLDGQSLYSLSSDKRAKLRREKIGFLFQTFNLVPYLSALENVQIPLLLAGLNGPCQKERAAALLQQVGLGDRLDHKPSELSVGQQQRVALARMLANNPEIILADEPTGNLDPETGEQIVALLEEINKEGRTVVMVTHDPRFAVRAKRTVRLRTGSVVPEENKSPAPPKQCCPH